MTLQQESVSLCTAALTCPEDFALRSVLGEQEHKNTF